VSGVTLQDNLFSVFSPQFIVYRMRIIIMYINSMRNKHIITYNDGFTGPYSAVFSHVAEITDSYTAAMCIHQQFTSHVCMFTY